MFNQEENVLVVGSGSFLLSLVESGYEFGLSKMTLFITKSEITDMDKLRNLREYALCNNPGVLLHILAATEDEKTKWSAIIQPFDFILYVSQHGNVEELLELQCVCIAEKKTMLPAVVVRGMGIAGPLLHPNGDGRWESVWRGLHPSVFLQNREQQSCPVIATKVLSNLILHEYHRVIAGEQETDCRNNCYLFDPETLTGSWEAIRPHPLVYGVEAARPVEPVQLCLENSHESVAAEEWFAYFRQLTSATTGIFHVWEEADLLQLPLAQCLVQPVDPLSIGPARLLPVMIRNGLTHEEARWEAGLAGLEAYATRIVPLLFPRLLSYQREAIGVGAGCTITEAIRRGFIAVLTQQWEKRKWTIVRERAVSRITCIKIEDVHCRYYLQALTIAEGEPLLAVGEPLLGCPVVWVHSGSSWYGCVDLDFTLALRQSLQKALSKKDGMESSAVRLRADKKQSITVFKSDRDSSKYATELLSVMQTLKQHRKCLQTFDMRSESFLDSGPFVLYGVSFKEEESP